MQPELTGMHAQIVLTKFHFPRFERESEPTIPIGTTGLEGGQGLVNLGDTKPYPQPRKCLESALNGLKRKSLKPTRQDLTQNPQIGQYLTGKICLSRLFGGDLSGVDCQIDDNPKKSRDFGGKMLDEKVVRAWLEKISPIVFDRMDERDSDFADGFLACMLWVLGYDEKTPIQQIRLWTED